MRSLLVVLAAAVLGLSSALLVACGDGGRLIPPTAADALNSDLDQASSALDAQECRRARQALAQALDRADHLPPSVDPQLRANLARGLSHAAERVSAGCRRKTPTVTTPTETAPPPTPTVPTPTETTTEHTTPPPTPTAPPPSSSNSGGTGSGDSGGGRHGGSGDNGGGAGGTSGGTAPGGGSR